jgi:hypothetical protein
MENLMINKTEKTPSINLNINGQLRIEGRSIPENSIGFYETPIAWLFEFRRTRPAKVELHVSLEYFNTSSGKLLLSLFRHVELLKMDGADAKIFWYYNENDEDMSEAGQDFESIIKLPFKYVQLV